MGLWKMKALKKLSRFMASTAEYMLVPFTEIGDLEGKTDLRSF